MFYSIMSAGLLENHAGSSEKSFCKKMFLSNITVLQLYGKAKLCPINEKAFKKSCFSLCNLCLGFFCMMKSHQIIL